MVTSSMGHFSKHAIQQRSVSPSLLTLVNMILEGTKEQSHEEGNQQAALSIAQLLKFNSIKHGWRSTDGSVRHTNNQETPLPHVKPRRKELAEILCALGLYVSYDRVLCLSSDLANAVCELYEENGTVCPSNLRDAAIFCPELVRCGCKTNCRNNRCKCCKAGLFALHFIVLV